MDGSILSEAKLLNASREFVCARLVTYEDAEEGEYLKMIGGSQRLDVANTTFALLAPNGKTTLSKSGRAPRQSFDNSEGELNGLLDAMKKVAAAHPGNGKTIGKPVPYVVDVRRALNVAACDNQPLVVFSSKDKKRQETTEKQLAELAWSPNFRGRFSFVKSVSTSDFEKIDNVPTNVSGEDVVFVVQPGTYGLTGKVISVARTLDANDLERMLKSGRKSFNKTPMDRKQLKTAKKNGVGWEEESIDSRAPKERSRTRNNKRQRNRDSSEG